MTQGKTTYIVGAGASVEFGLPTGRALLAEISRLPQKRTPEGKGTVLPEPLEGAISDLARKTGRTTLGGRKELVDAADWVCRNCLIAPSIDNLLHAHNKDEDVKALGKILIAYSICRAELGSSLYSSEGKLPHGCFQPRTMIDGSRHSPTDSWLGRLFWFLAEGSDFDSFKEKLSLINFIVFNYDRCLEFFIVNAAKSYFNLDDLATSDLFASLNIVHPYGDLGPLTIQDRGAVGFGETRDLLSAAEGISTFTEQNLDVAKRKLISHYVSQADNITFLGFGFLKLNMSLLFDGISFERPPWFRGTSLGLSTDSQVVIHNSLVGITSEALSRTSQQELIGIFKANLHEVGCKDFFDHYHFRLRS